MVSSALAVDGEPVAAGGGAEEAARLVGVWGRAKVGGSRPEQLWGRWDAKWPCWDDTLGGGGRA